MISCNFCNIWIMADRSIPYHKNEVIISLRPLFMPGIYEYLKSWIFSKVAPFLLQSKERLWHFPDIVAPAAHWHVGYLFFSCYFSMFLVCQVGCCHFPHPFSSWKLSPACCCTQRLSGIWCSPLEEWVCLWARVTEITVKVGGLMELRCLVFVFLWLQDSLWENGKSWRLRMTSLWRKLN